MTADRHLGSDPTGSSANGSADPENLIAYLEPNME